MKIVNNRLEPVNFIGSENYNERPDKIELIVIHNISLPPKKFGGNEIIDFFCNQLDCNSHPYFLKIKNLKVSSHLLIRRDGEIIQFVDFDKRAWHAGVSSFAGKPQCNDFSIGIELEGADDIEYTDAQYLALNKVNKLLMETYPVKNIVGHSDIAPGRKTDPGQSFDWVRIENNR